MRLRACLFVSALVLPLTAVPAQPAAGTSPVEAAPAAPAVDPALPENAADGLPPSGPAEGDPFEGLNRGIWGFNQGVDKILLKPASQVYKAVTPRPARRGIRRIFSNLSEPWSFINNLLQGKPGRAINNLGRFVVNTTLGVGGLADHATKMGIKPSPEDFGQTLAAWGVRSSAYLVLPLLGPSTVRDGIGSGVGFVADPYQIALNEAVNDPWVRFGIQALNIVDTRALLTETGADAFLQSSLDPYAAARSAFFQRRGQQIADEDNPGDLGAAVNVDPTQADAPPAADQSAPADGGVAAPDPAEPRAIDPAAPPLDDPAPAPPEGTVSGPKLSYLLTELKG